MRACMLQADCVGMIDALGCVPELLVLLISGAGNLERRRTATQVWARWDMPKPTGCAAVRILPVLVGADPGAEQAVLRSDGMLSVGEPALAELQAFTWAATHVPGAHVAKADDDAVLCLAGLLSVLRAELGPQRAPIAYAGRMFWTPHDLQVRSDPGYAGVFGGRTASSRKLYYARYAQGGAYVIGSRLVPLVSRAARERGLLSPNLTARPIHEDAAIGALVRDVRTRHGSPVVYADLFTPTMRFLVDSRSDKNWSVAGVKLVKRCNSSSVLAVHPVKLAADQHACFEMLQRARRRSEPSASCTHARRATGGAGVDSWPWRGAQRTGT